ncbi:hypothetical protein [Luteolibacter sp. AS25]|uniref:hypothetical protein n=1 Tax=Luteolibacter sp. AS25 TaxID=3135776 RepID=UPI00398B5A5B
MKTPTAVILAMSALDCAGTNDFVSWAIDELLAGNESEALAVLAGFDEGVSSFELQEYFEKAKRELGVSEPTRSEALGQYTTYLVQSILDPDSDYRPIVAKLATLCHTNNYPSNLMEWYELDDGLADLASAKNYPFAYPELHGANPKDVVEKVAREFIKANKAQMATPRKPSDQI